MSTTEPTAGATRDARKLVKTGTPGVYKRVNPDGSAAGYQVVYRAGGRQRKESARTLAAARALKRAREADRDRGEFHERTTITLRGYLAEWIDAYRGNGRRGFREGTREEYRRLLDRFAHVYFGERLRLVDVTPRHLSQYVAWLADADKQGRRAAVDKRAQLAERRGVPLAQVPTPAPKPLALADATISNAVIPVRAALATAQREGLIRHDPAARLALPRREQVREDEAEHVKALSRDQLAMLLALAPERHRLLLEVIASCGLRISEAIALQRRHLRLDGSRPHLRVRRAIVRGRVEPPKTRHGRRSVPLPHALVLRLRSRLADLPDEPDAPVFPSQAGGALDPDNLRARVLKPLVEEAGAPWAGFHTLRHTYASLQLAAGVNVLSLSRALGHHSPAFTLERYCHLLPGDEAPALDLSEALAAPADAEALAAVA